MFIYINPIQDLAIFHPWRYLIFFGGNAKNDKNGAHESLSGALITNYQRFPTWKEAKEKCR